MTKEKYITYAVLVSEKISELIKENPEVLEEDNLTDFMHALINVAPNNIYNEITGDNKNNLEFNHLANHLLIQYLKKEEEIIKK